MWDASMPKVEQSSHFPHMFFWTPDGLIRRICMRNTYPDKSFWLTGAQLGMVDDGMVVPWRGENAPEEEFESDNESDSEAEDESESESESEQEEVDPTANDVRDKDGCALSAIQYVPSKGTQRLADEYTPNGSLVISVELVPSPSTLDPVSLEWRKER